MPTALPTVDFDILTTIDPLDPKKRWDGFQWVQRGSQMTQDPTTMNQTRRLRRVQISNLPLYLGLTEDQLVKVVTDYLLANYLADTGNSAPVLACEINRKERSCVVELSSVEEANRFSKVPEISILNMNCKVTRLGESMYGTTTNTAAILQAAHVSFRDLNCSKLPRLKPRPTRPSACSQPRAPLAPPGKTTSVYTRWASRHQSVE